MLDSKGIGRKIDFFSETFHEKKSKTKQLNKDLLTKDEKFGEISEIWKSGAQDLTSRSPDRDLGPA